MQNNNSDSLGIRINYKDENAAWDLASYIKNLIKPKTLILCIGTDKCIGDCLGPLVGTFLSKEPFPYPVIGTLENLLMQLI